MPFILDRDETRLEGVRRDLSLISQHLILPVLCESGPEPNRTKLYAGERRQAVQVSGDLKEGVVRREGFEPAQLSAVAFATRFSLAAPPSGSKIEYGFRYLLGFVRDSWCLGPVRIGNDARGEALACKSTRLVSQIAHRSCLLTS